MGTHRNDVGSTDDPIRPGVGFTSTFTELGGGWTRTVIDYDCGCHVVGSDVHYTADGLGYMRQSDEPERLCAEHAPIIATRMAKLTYP